MRMPFLGQLRELAPCSWFCDVLLVTVLSGAMHSHAEPGATGTCMYCCTINAVFFTAAEWASHPPVVAGFLVQTCTASAGLMSLKRAPALQLALS